jgi:hypothetical protein
VEASTPAGASQSPANQSGDIDGNGDLVGAIFARLPSARARRLAAAMPDADLIADDVDAAAQLELVAGLLDGAR